MMEVSVSGFFSSSRRFDYQTHLYNGSSRLSSPVRRIVIIDWVLTGRSELSRSWDVRLMLKKDDMMDQLRTDQVFARLKVSPANF